MLTKMENVKIATSEAEFGVLFGQGQPFEVILPIEAFGEEPNLTDNFQPFEPINPGPELLVVMSNSNSWWLAAIAKMQLEGSKMLKKVNNEGQLVVRFVPLGIVQEENQ